MMESKMMMVTHKLDTYNYSVVDDDSIDSDDEKFNYVIDLDYKEEESTEATESSDSDKSEDKRNSEEVSHAKSESVEEVRNEEKETGYNYTLQNAPVLDLRPNKRTSDVHEENAIISNEIQEKKESSYLYVLDSNLTSKETTGDRTEQNLQEKSSVLNIDTEKLDKPELVSPVEESDAISYVKSNTIEDIDKECNKQSAEGNQLSVPKLVGANKRKRKFSLENTITNIMKVKAQCTRDLPMNDISLSRQSSSSPSSVALSDHSNLSSSTSQHSIPSPKLSSSSIHYSNIPLKTSTPAKNDMIPKSPDLHSFRNFPVLSHTLSKTSFSPIIKPSLSPHISSNLFSALSNSTQVSSDSLQYVPEKFSNRRKSHVTLSDNNVLDMTVRKQTPETHETSKEVLSYQDGVIDLSKPSKAKSDSITKDSEVSMKNDNEPVDLSLSSHKLVGNKVTEKKEKEMGTGSIVDQLKVMDIFKDMMNQTGGGGRAVSMQQFVQWMRKMQPNTVENMNMMQLSAYFMQFNYWMQSFLNNTYMNGVSNRNGLTRPFEAKKVKARNGRRKTLPSQFTEDNSLSPESNRKEIKLERSIGEQEVDDKPIHPSVKTMKSNVSDYNSNNIHLENTNFSRFPEIGALKNQYGCQVSERDGKIKFMVRDNEEILSIVSTMMKTADLHESEMQDLDRDENGLCAKFVCRICNQKFFHLEHLSKHIKTSHVQKRFQCAQCDRSFHDAGNYRQHIRVHDETDIPYECPECNRRFRHKCTLKVHMRIHTGEKPFKCDICQASFKISSGLQTHMRKHTGETPYACEFCSLRFKCQSNLKQHLFQHTQARPFTCDVCGKSYSRKSIRDSHLLTHFKNSNVSNDLNETI